MGDVAQAAVPLAEPGTNPIRHFSPQGGVGVVDTDEFTHRHAPRLWE